MNFPAKTNVSRSDDKKEINIQTNTEFNMGAQKSEVMVNETWRLNSSGETLVIKQTSNTPWGKRDITIVYSKD